MIIKDYEAIKKSIEDNRISFDPGLEESLVLSDENFRMTAMKVQHNCLFMHWHSYFEIVIFNSGEAVCFVDGSRFTVSEGDIMFVNSGQIHAAYSINNTEMSFTPVIFDRSVFAGYPMDKFFMDFMKPFLEGRLTLPNIVRKDNSQYGSISGIIKGILQEFESRSMGYQLCIRAYLQELMVKMSRASGFEEKRAGRNDIYKSHDFKKLFDLLATDYSEKITLNQAAAIVNLSVYHFCKVFKEMTGMTFVRYLNLNRVNAAESLLRNTQLSITEITEKTGFCNINYFDRVFKQLKGYPPSFCRE